MANGQLDIGLMGVGVMGRNLALNLADNGYTVALFDTDPEKLSGLDHPGLTGFTDLSAFTVSIRIPRAVIIMVPAGAALDMAVDTLLPELQTGDILIDAGNSNHHDTKRREAELAQQGFEFIGMGVSGGAEGARKGPAIMAGGSQQAWNRAAPMLTAIAAKYHGESCAGRMGPDSAGHFVKTIHNGIEYALMQMIADVYALLRDGAGYTPADMAPLFADLNSGYRHSYLMGITEEICRTLDPETGRPMLDIILDRAAQKGTGRWTALEAQDLGQPANLVEAALLARAVSSQDGLRREIEDAFGSGITGFDQGSVSKDDLGAGLLAGMALAFWQGLQVIEAGSREWNWDLKLTEIAKVWRAGCIISGELVSTIAAQDEPFDATRMITGPFYKEILNEGIPALRRIVILALQDGIAVPTLSGALALFDLNRTARGSANMLQAQRDFFGQHGFERMDKEGRGYHGPWAG